MSYVQLLAHAIVRTYRSERTLPADERVKFLYQEMYGIINKKGGRLYRINSMPDHVHLLFTMPATLERNTKHLSKKWAWCLMSVIGIDNKVSSLRDFAGL